MSNQPNSKIKWPEFDYKMIMHECEICLLRFESKEEFLDHMKICKEEEKVVHCKLCSESFYTSRALDRHSIDSHSDVDFQCPTCETDVPDWISARKHIQCHGFPCLLCNVSFQIENDFLDHFYVKHRVHSSISTMDILHLQGFPPEEVQTVSSFVAAGNQMESTSASSLFSGSNIKAIKMQTEKKEKTKNSFTVNNKTSSFCNGSINLDMLNNAFLQLFPEGLNADIAGCNASEKQEAQTQILQKYFKTNIPMLAQITDWYKKIGCPLDSQVLKYLNGVLEVLPGLIDSCASVSTNENLTVLKNIHKDLLNVKNKHLKFNSKKPK